jgi:hypothetical protein
MAAIGPGRALPHPRDHFLLGSVPAFVRDTLQTFMNGWRECGDIVLFRGLRRMCLIAHPDYVKHVLDDNSGQNAGCRWVTYGQIMSGA